MYMYMCRKIKNAIIGNQMRKSSFILLGVIPRSVCVVYSIIQLYTIRNIHYLTTLVSALLAHHVIVIQ